MRCSGGFSLLSCEASCEAPPLLSRGELFSRDPSLIGETGEDCIEATEWPIERFAGDLSDGSASPVAGVPDPQEAREKTLEPLRETGVLAVKPLSSAAMKELERESGREERESGREAGFEGFEIEKLASDARSSDARINSSSATTPSWLPRSARKRAEPRRSSRIVDLWSHGWLCIVSSKSSTICSSPFSHERCSGVIRYESCDMSSLISPPRASSTLVAS
mmetsp:Transcript_7422/g.17336  ORF Transcript_7422/g.17336 Transcript_7422/m.17336 type:complete len:221 (-) Transcript_7422:615-1277(-)